jgi:hypothetical protein
MNMPMESAWENESNVENFRELSVRQLDNTLERQREEIEIQREKLIDFIRYYIIIIGFAITISQFGNFDRIYTAISVVFPIIGIFYAALLHRHMGEYRIGLSSNSYEVTLQSTESYNGALKELTEDIDEMITYNRGHLNQYQKNIFRLNTIFGASFGALTGVLVFVV